MAKTSTRRPTKKKTSARRKSAKPVQDVVEDSNLQNYKELPIDVLVQADWNYKKNDEKLQKKLADNIEKNGQIENILVRPLGNGEYEVVNGNHRYMALKSLGVKKAIVYDLGEISLQQAQRIAIETNETKFESDNVALAEILSNLTDEFGIADLEVTMPYTGDELSNFSEMLNFDWEGEEKAEEEESDSSKSSTTVSAGGEKFRTLKLELSPKLADFFEESLDRLKDPKGSSEKPIEYMLNFISNFEVKEIKKAKRKKLKS